MSDPTHTHLVIGGGISGLSAAYYSAKAGVATLLLERDQRLGGCMQTHAFASLGGFWIEAGSHSCFNSYGNLLEIMQRLDLLERATAKAKQGYKLWRDGKRASILSALHLPELLVSLPRLLSQQKSECSVMEYYGRGLGRRNYRDLFGPAFRSVICQTADEFPAEALFRKKPRRKDVLRSFTMPSGLSEIPMAIAAKAGMQVESGRTATAIVAQDHGFGVRLADGAELSCRYLTLAVPPDVAARLLADVAPEAAALIGGIAVAEIDSLLLAFDKADLGVPEMAGLISVDGAFLSAVSRDFMADDRYRGFAFHFPGGTYNETERISAACAALDVNPDKAVATAQLANRLPSLRKGHQGLIGALDKTLAGLPLAVTGNWFLGVSIEDCVTRSRSEHERLFAATRGKA
jgi:oxygen-dependent protoporphyrinogen oxidase